LRDAKDVGPINAKVTEESGEVFVVGVRGWRYVRLSVASKVVADDLVLAAERGDLIVPHPPVGDAGVDENDGMSLSGHVVGEVGAVDLSDS
jgi:hypothetical protein